MINAVGEGHEALATKADLQALEMRLDTRLQSVELRMTLRLGALVMAAAVVLAVLELIP